MSTHSTPYTPVDVTPPELLTDALTDPEPWIIDTQATPDQITDWPVRIAAALIPFTLDTRGWPINPVSRTGRIGRDLPRWGENQAADPLVLAGTGHERHILLIRRDDTHQWAIPGGMVDPGETAPAALVRELAEETGVDLSGMAPQTLDRTYVDDPRNTDNAWIVSTVALYQVPVVVDAVAGDDAEEAQWWPWTSAAALESTLAPHGGLYPAHRALFNTLDLFLSSTDNR